MSSVPFEPTSATPVLSPFGAQPYGDGTALQTWQLTSPYVSAFDNAHGSGTDSTGANVDGTGAAPTTPLTDNAGHVLPTPTQTMAFPSGTQTVQTMPLRVNVLLPPGYDPSGATRYPVLYLLGGSLDDAGFSQFLWEMDAEPAVVAAENAGGHPMIVVMPDTSVTGDSFDWYGQDSDHVNGSDTPAWETFYADQLVPFVDSTYPTRANASARFLAGVSAGAGAAMILAGHRPDTFAAVGGFSGAVDSMANLGLTDFPHLVPLIAMLHSVAQDGPSGLCAEGDPYPSDVPNQYAYWQAQDPVFLAQQSPSPYVDTRIWLVSGEGENPLDPASDTEFVVGTMTENFAAALAGDPNPQNILRGWTAYNTGFADTTGATPAGRTVAATGATNDCAPTATRCVLLYQGGTHTPDYWKTDLTSFLTWIEGQM